MILVALFIIGICLGSFINALVWRLHEQLDDEGGQRKLSNKRKRELSIYSGRSMCPSCRHTLAWIDLVPLFSWVGLRGKCRYCRTPISVQYPLVELATGLLFAVSYVYWPSELNTTWQGLQFVTWLAALVSMVALAMYDARWMLLPDRILLPTILFVALSTALQFMLGRPLEQATSIAGALVVSSGIFAVVYFASVKLQRPLIGLGDVKLGILLGLLIGTALEAAVMLFVASLLGVMYALGTSMGKRWSNADFWQRQIPFGPFLMAGTAVAVLLGSQLLDWYLRAVGLY